MSDLKSLNGLVSANIKSINGLAIASVKSYNGLLIQASGWDISNASYDNKNFSVDSQVKSPANVFFNSDGTKMYVSDNQYNKVHQYTLSTAWDISTASYDNKSFSVGSQESSPRGIFFKSDGTKMYIIGTNNDEVYQYTLSTAWDVSTASYASKSFSVGSQDNDANCLFFKSDGTKMYIIGTNNDEVYQYTLSTAWDISTASYDNKKSPSIWSQEPNGNGLFFNPDGNKMYISGRTNCYVCQYTLSTAWDISTASYDNKRFYLKSQADFPYGLFFNSDGNKMYICGTTSYGSFQRIYQYSL